MATTIDLALQKGEQRFVVQHVSWGTYECLLADHTDASTPRFTYSEGMLEIMEPLDRARENKPGPSGGR